MVKRIAVVILNWNGYKDTLECISSILKADTSGLTCDIIVVDNNSTNNSLQELAKAVNTKKNPRVFIVSNRENLGFAGGNNVGIRYALNLGATNIIILNNDTEIDSKCIKELLKSADRFPKAIITPKIYFAPGFEFHKKRYKKSEQGSVIWCAGGEIDWNNVYGKNIGVDEVDSGQFEEELPVDFATGACMALPSKIITECGMFDERYYLYLEDLELSQRVKSFGYQVVYSPKAKLWHKVSQSSAIGSSLNDYFITRNRLLFGSKYAPLRAKFALIRESLRFMLFGRTWQRIGAVDFYLRRFQRGSYSDNSK